MAGWKKAETIDKAIATRKSKKAKAIHAAKEQGKAAKKSRLDALPASHVTAPAPPKKAAPPPAPDPPDPLDVPPALLGQRNTSAPIVPAIDLAAVQADNGTGSGVDDAGEDGEQKPLWTTIPERQALSLQLRSAGHDYRKIAEVLGVSVKTAYYDVQEGLGYLREHEKVLAEDVKAIHLTRLDLMLSYIWPRVENGDTFAIGTALSVMQRQASLLGLNAPIEVDLNVKRPLREAKLEDLQELLQRLAGQRPGPEQPLLSTSPTLPLTEPAPVLDAEWQAGGDDDQNGD